MIWILLAAASSTFDADERFCQIDALHQGYQFCMAEREYERADKRLNMQWAHTYGYVRTHKGKAAAFNMRLEQRAWLKKSDRRCGDLARTMRAPYQGDTYDRCLTELYDQRSAKLRAMNGSK